MKARSRGAPLNRRNLLTAAAGGLVSAACASEAPAAAPTWRAGPPMPFATQEIYPALHNGGVWTGGGFSPQARGATERVIVLDVAANRWSEGPALPTPSHHVQFVSLAGDLYAIGGFLGGATRTQWICTPRVLKLQGDAWIEAASLPRPMAECVSVAHAGRIHLIGGRSPRGAANANYGDHDDVADHYVFAPESGWSQAAPLPMARNSSASALVGDRFHVISGRTLSGAATPQHDIYDFRAARWESGAPYPEPRGGLAAAYWGGRIVCGGGELLLQRAVSDQLHALEGGAWSSAGAMPTARHGHGLVSANTALIAIGGSRQVATVEPLDSVDILAG